MLNTSIRKIQTLALLIALQLIGLSVFCQNDERESWLEKGNYYFEKSETLVHDYDSCIYYTLLAQPFFKKAEAWEQYVECYLGLSTIHYYKGNFDQYILYSDSAQSESLKYLGKDSETFAYVQNNLGVYFRRKGDYAKAIELYKNSISTQKELGDNPAFLARTYRNLGKVYQSKGDYEEAIKFFKRAIYIISSNKTSLRSSDIFDLIYLSTAYQRLKQIDSAKIVLIQATKLLKKIPEKERHFKIQAPVTAYQNLSKIYVKVGKLDSAQFFLNKSLSLQKESTAFNRYHSFEIQSDIYSNNGKKKQALQELLKAEKNILSNKPSNKDKLLALIFEKMGGLNVKLQRFDKALDHYNNAITNLCYLDKKETFQTPKLEEVIFPRELLEILKAKGKLLLSLSEDEIDSQKYLEEGHNTMRLAKSLISDLRQNYLATGSKLILAETASELYEATIEIDVKLYERTNDQQYLYTALESAELNKSILLTESIHADIAKVSLDMEDSILQKERNLEIDITFYQKLILREKQKKEKADQQKIALWTNKIFEFSEQEAALTELISKEYPSYFKMKYDNLDNPISFFIETLEDSDLVLEYFVGKENSYVFELTNNSIQVKRILWDEKVEHSLKELLLTISAPPELLDPYQQYEKFVSNAQLLHKTLLPFEIDKGSVSKLIIIPDGELSFLPFDLLIKDQIIPKEVNFKPNKLNYLLNDFALSYDYSLRLFKLNSAEKERIYQSDFIGFAPFTEGELVADVRNCESSLLSKLACSETEVNQINDLLEGKVSLGKAASVERFIETAKDASIVHLATHACVNKEEAMLSNLFFGEESLTAFEIGNLELNNELTVLSACKSGIGNFKEGEGVFSLARSFIQAGSQSVVMSLWSVNDCKTADIMTSFYENLVKGLGKSESLRQSKLSYLASAKTIESHPFYWASFIQLGNDDALGLANQSNSFFKYGLLIVGIFILGLGFIYTRKV